jgi:hypothetical protein
MEASVEGRVSATRAEHPLNAEAWRTVTEPGMVKMDEPGEVRSEEQFSKVDA